MDQNELDFVKSDEIDSNYIKIPKREFQELENDLGSSRDLLNHYVDSLNKSKQQLDRKDSEVSL